MIQCETKIDGIVQKEILKTKLKISMIFIIIGAIGSALYCILSATFEDAKWLDILLIFAFILGVSIVINLYYKKIIKNVNAKPFVNQYSFDEENLLISSKNENGELLSKSETPYKNFLKVTQNKNYIFIFPSPKFILPVKKSNLNSQEIELILSFFKKFDKLQTNKF